MIGFMLLTGGGSLYVIYTGIRDLDTFQFARNAPQKIRTIAVAVVGRATTQRHAPDSTLPPESGATTSRRGTSAGTGAALADALNGIGDEFSDVSFYWPERG